MRRIVKGTEADYDRSPHISLVNQEQEDLALSSSSSSTSSPSKGETSPPSSFTFFFYYPRVFFFFFFLSFMCSGGKRSNSLYTDEFGAHLNQTTATTVHDIDKLNRDALFRATFQLPATEVLLERHSATFW